MRPGVVYVLTMAEAFAAEREGASIDWLSVFVARDAVPELDAALWGALYRPLDSVAGRLLAGLMSDIADVLPHLEEPDLPHLARAVHALLAAALAGAEGTGDGPHNLEDAQLGRVKRLVREHLAAATLRPGRLAALAGMSRSQLYRLFEPLGGVAHYIQAQRLRHASRRLSDPAERRDIATIAEAAGFFDPSSFSRAFRREFGCSPREMRIAAQQGGVPVRAAVPRAETVWDLMRSL
jgi:AraC-like DNA-binding protein